MGGKGTYGCLLAGIVVGIFLNGCSPLAGKRLLTLFFDGVPAADTSRVRIPADSLRSADQLVPGEPGPETPLTSLVVHYPYGERECGVCHDPNSLGSMVEPEPGLCYMCHDDYNNSYSWLHGPVAGGYCTACHDPHSSREGSLLKLTGNSLCFHCHREEDVLKNDMHAELGDMSCTDCHNPHGGEDQLILY
jgi:predicted CXXCH cytochrome family protein